METHAEQQPAEASQSQLARIAEHRDAIRELLAIHRAHDARIFGSVARGDDGPGSDIDILVEFSDEATLLDEVGLRLALSDLLGVDGDACGADTLRGEMRDRILRDAVPA